MKYYDKVKVTAGFYEGLEGNVVDREVKMPIDYDVYYVRGYKKIGIVMQEWSAWLSAKYLEKVEE